MWIFVLIPGVLSIVTFIVEITKDAIEQWREDHPYIGHLNYRDNRVGRYYSTRR